MNNLKNGAQSAVLESTWMLNSSLTTAEMRDTLSATEGLLDSNDRLVVVRVKTWSSYRPMADIHQIEHLR